MPTRRIHCAANANAHSVAYRTGSTLSHALQTQLQSALLSIRNKVVDPDALKHIPDTPSKFHQEFGKGLRISALPQSKTALMKSSKLQHILSAGLHKKAREQLLNIDTLPLDGNIIKMFKARQLAITAPKAHLWCTTVPTEPNLKLRDHEYMLSSRIRLGLKPVDNMSEYCRACKNPIKGDPYHFLSCSCKLSNPITMRHNLVVQTLAKLVDMSGGIARGEPTHIDFQESKSNYNRTDIEALLGNRHYLIDVSITTPTNPWALRCNRSSVEQLGTAKRTAIEKVKKHRENAEYIQAKFVPFIMESYGGMVPQCREFLGAIQYYAMDNVSTSVCHKLSSLLYSSISIAVQRGNSLILRKCIGNIPKIRRPMDPIPFGPPSHSLPSSSSSSSSRNSRLSP